MCKNTAAALPNFQDARGGDAATAAVIRNAIA